MTLYGSATFGTLARGAVAAQCAGVVGPIGPVAQRGAFRRYVFGLLSDSRRKSMSAMLERINDPGAYQAFQHFITDAPWIAARVWQQLRRVIPERTGVLILD